MPRGRSPVAGRPVEPDPDVLRLAADRLVAEGSVVPAVGWRVERRLERPRSTIFVLEAVHADGRVRLHYKVEHVLGGPGAKRDRKRRLRRDALAREPALSGALADALRDEGVAVDRPVVVDPERLTAVRVHVEGRPLGRVVQQGMRGRGRAWWPYRVLGRTLRVMEQMPRTSGADAVTDDVRSRLERRLAAAAPHLAAVHRRRVETQVQELLERVDPTALAWSRGDVTESNVLVDDRRKRIGLIDFTWHPRPLGHDGAQFVARLEYQWPRWPAWTDKARTAFLREYGVDPEAPPAEWELAYLDRALVCLGKRSRRAQAWGREVVEGRRSATATS